MTKEWNYLVSSYLFTRGRICVNVLFKHSLSAILKSCNEKIYGLHLLDLFVYYTMSDNDNKSDLLNVLEGYISTQWPPFISKKVIPAYLYHSQCGQYQLVLYILPKGKKNVGHWKKKRNSF